MRYLVVGDASSMHIYNFVKTVLLKRNYEVHLLTLSVKPIRPEFLAFYKENGVVTHSLAEKGYKGLDKIDKFHRVLNLLRKYKLMADMPKVDVCHIHSVYKTAMGMVYMYRKKFNTLICSYWGGDIRALNPKELALREKCFNFANVITVTVKQIYLDFQKIHGNKYNDKLKICRFATDGLECINSLANSVSLEDCKNEYNIPKGKLCVTCGYSATEEQHQDLILEKLQNLPADIKQKLFVIVPMQYGSASDAYKNKVKTLLAESDFEGTVLETYVPFEKSAMLAIATDIYLHLRDTDAFSNALKEHVYAGSTIISGKWLKYIELDEMKAPIKYISDFDELESTLISTIKSFKPNTKLTIFDPIYDLYSTKNIIKAWEEIIDFATKEGLLFEKTV